MILCQRPRLYDVDLMGLFGALILVAAGLWLALAPWQRTWSTYKRLATARAAAQERVHQEIVKLERFERGLAPLEDTVQTQATHVPTADSFSRLLGQMTDVARASNLELRNVAPQPAVPNGMYLVSDVLVGGRGQSQDFIRFLDRLAQENPYQMLRSCSIVRSPADTQATCELTYTLRLYLLPGTPATPDGGGS
jgi:Tfp pilus assembly protein PilO